MGTILELGSKRGVGMITFMFYAIVIHKKSLPIFNRPLYYHIYTTVAFAMILMTYFGVNYFLGGMHSYA
jgi:ABC-type transport system involved in cytochrome c biogenesis permease subunit